MSKTNTLTSQDLGRSSLKVSQELADAKASYGRAAYEYALNREDEKARARVVEAKRDIEVLEGELEGLSAAKAEATKRESAEALRMRIAGIKDQEAAAVSILEEVEPKLEAVQKAISELRDAYGDLVGVANAANYRYKDFTERARKGNSQQFINDLFRVEPLVEALLWQALGCRNRDLRRSEVVMSAGGNVDVDEAARIVRKKCYDGVHKVRACCASEVAAVEAELAASDQSRAPKLPDAA